MLTSLLPWCLWTTEWSVQPHVSVLWRVPVSAGHIRIPVSRSCTPLHTIKLWNINCQLCFLWNAPSKRNKSTLEGHLKLLCSTICSGLKSKHKKIIVFSSRYVPDYFGISRNNKQFYSFNNKNRSDIQLHFTNKNTP